MNLSEDPVIPPCLIITYMRPENCVRLIESLHNQGCKRIYIAIDSGKTKEIKSKQSNYNSLKDRYQYKFDKFEIWQRHKNLGVAVSVITAIDWFFKNEDSGVILEDDLEISGNFLKFMSNGLEKLSQHSNIFAISGSNFFPDEKGINFLTNYFIGWGWGTWKNRWEKAKINYLNHPTSPSLCFNEKVNFWNIGAYRCKIGLVDTWDLELSKYVRDNKFLNVVAGSNLVSNIGFDDNSTNTKINEFPLKMLIEDLNLAYLTFTNLEIDPRFDGKLEKLVFRIKFRHKFLFLLYCRDLLKSLLIKTTLPEKISSIKIP
jgi:hypothetical protein